MCQTRHLTFSMVEKHLASQVKRLAELTVKLQAAIWHIDIVLGGSPVGKRDLAVC